MEIDSKRCVGCGNCVPYCTMGVIRVENGIAVVSGPEIDAVFFGFQDARDLFAGRAERRHPGGKLKVHLIASAARAEIVNVDVRNLALVGIASGSAWNRARPRAQGLKFREHNRASRFGIGKQESGHPPAGCHDGDTVLKR